MKAGTGTTCLWAERTSPRFHVSSFPRRCSGQAPRLPVNIYGLPKAFLLGFSGVPLPLQTVITPKTSY